MNLSLSLTAETPPAGGVESVPIDAMVEVVIVRRVRIDVPQGDAAEAWEGQDKEGDAGAFAAMLRGKVVLSVMGRVEHVGMKVRSYREAGEDSGVGPLDFAGMAGELDAGGVEIRAGLRLWSKDGRSIGNGIVLKVWESGQVGFETDFGGVGLLGADHVRRYWHLTDAEGVARYECVTGWRVARMMKVSPAASPESING